MAKKGDKEPLRVSDIREMAKDLRFKVEDYEQIANDMEKREVSVIEAENGAMARDALAEIAKHIGKVRTALAAATRAPAFKDIPLDENHPVAKQIEAARTPEERVAANEALSDLADGLIDEYEAKRKQNKRNRKNSSR